MRKLLISTLLLAPFLMGQVKSSTQAIQDLCEKKNDVAACGLLGDAYREGSRVKADSKRAFQYFLKACNLGAGQECNRAAQVIVAEDRAQAMKLFQQGCKLKDQLSCMFLRVPQKETQPAPLQMVQLSPPGSESHVGVGPNRRAWFIRESVRLGYQIGEEPNWSEMRDLCLGKCPEHYFVNPQSGDSEIHMIGIYSPGEPKVDKDGKVESKGILVRVHKTPKPVTLMMTSYEPAMWEVVADPGAKLKAIYVGGYHPGKVIKSPDGVPIKNLPEQVYGLDPNGREGDSGAGRYLQTAQNLTGAKPTSFQGIYRGDSFEIPFYWDPTIFAEIRALHQRDLKAKTVENIKGSFPYVKNGQIHWQGEPPSQLAKSLPLKISPNGVTTVTYSEVDGMFYGCNSHDFFSIDSTTGTMSKLSPPPGYPRMTWLAGAAYDPVTKRVYVASTWHAGHHHSYNPKTKEWRAYPIENFSGFVGIAYDPALKQMWGLSQRQLAKVNENFKATPVAEIGEAFPSTGAPQQAQVAVSGDWIYARMIDGPTSRNATGVYLIHKQSGEVRPYKGE